MPTPSADTEPGKAAAEDGFVVLDGPGGVAVTMTASAAEGTGHSFVSAALVAKRQSAEKGPDDQSGPC